MGCSSGCLVIDSFEEPAGLKFNRLPSQTWGKLECKAQLCVSALFWVKSLAVLAAGVLGFSEQLDGLLKMAFW